MLPESLDKSGMKPLLVNYEYPGVTSNCGGGGRVTDLLKEGLETRNHDPVVITDDADGHFATFPARSYTRLRRRVREINPDILHGHFAVPSSLGLPFANGDTPIVVSVMGADVHDPTRFDTIRPITDRVNDWLFRRASATVVPSSDMGDRVASKHGIEPRRIPYGIDASNWTWRARKLHDPVRVLTVARLVQRKNLDVAREAVNAVRDRGRRVRWRIVGDGPLRDRVDKWAANHRDTVARGYVDSLQSEYDWANLFLLPSAHEAFGMVFLEALACGVPVVTSTTGGQTDIVQKPVGVTRPPTPDAIADGVQEVIAHYRQFQRLTEGYVEREFSVEKMVDDYLSLYNQFL